MKIKLLVILLLMVPLLGFTTDGVKVKKYKKAGTFEPIEVEKVKLLDEKPEAKHLLIGEIHYMPATKIKPEEFDKVMVAEAAKIGAHALYYKIGYKYIRRKGRGANIRGRMLKVKVKTGMALRFVD